MIQLNHIHKAFGKKVIFDQMSATFDQPGRSTLSWGPPDRGKPPCSICSSAWTGIFTGSYTLFGRDASELTNRDWEWDPKQPDAAGVPR